MSVNLHQTLYNTTDALNVHTRAIEVVGQNIANVNNEDYATRKVRISANPTMTVARGNHGGTVGILDLSIVTERDAIVDRQIVQSDMRTGKLEREAQNNELLESLLGESFQLNAQGALETGDDFSTKGISYALRQFFNACSALSANPTSSAEKLNVLSHGQNLVDKFTYMRDRFSEMENNIDLRINDEVNEVNRLLSEIALQTQKINDFENPHTHTKAFELRESRQANLERLGRLMDIAITDDASTFTISTGGTTLLDGKRVCGTLSFNGGQFAFGTHAIAISKGSIGGDFTTKTSRIPFMRNKINTWIEHFVTQTNGAYASNNDGSKLFDGTDLDSFAFKATLTNLKTSSSDANPSANDRINAVIEALTHTQNGASLEEEYRTFIIDTAQAFNSTLHTLEGENLVHKMLTQQRENRIGVSIDSEMVNLIKSQKAFQASAKIVVLIDELLETSINLVRR